MTISNTATINCSTQTRLSHIKQNLQQSSTRYLDYPLVSDSACWTSQGTINDTYEFDMKMFRFSTMATLAMVRTFEQFAKLLSKRTSLHVRRSEFVLLFLSSPSTSSFFLLILESFHKYIFFKPEPLEREAWSTQDQQVSEQFWCTAIAFKQV